MVALDGKDIMKALASSGTGEIANMNMLDLQVRLKELPPEKRKEVVLQMSAVNLTLLVNQVVRGR